MMKTTPWKVYREGGQTFRIQAKYGIDYDFARRHNQAPHFGITATIDRKDDRPPFHWREDSGGAMHAEVARRFPTLAPYIKWHLVSTDGPLHYIANGKYQWEIANGLRAPAEYQRIDPWEAFKSTVIFGGLPDDAATAPPRNASWPEWEEWLRDRLPRLRETFLHAMGTLGVLE